MKAKNLSFVVLLVLLTSCGDGSRQAADDKISAQNNFEYFQSASQKILQSIQLAKKELSRGDQVLAEENIDKAEESVRFLLSYQIPLMEVRRLINDSWRLYGDGRVAELDRFFDQAGQLLEKIKQDRWQQTSAIEDTQATLDDVKLTIRKTRYAISNKYQLQDPSSVASKFYLLIDKINKLALAR